MKLIFTYDSTELQEIGQVFPNVNHNQQVHVLTKQRHLFDVADDIQKELKEQKDAIIFINQFLACADVDFEWLQRNAGIALIKFLRMMEVKQHIVLITPYDEIHLIRENLVNLIVTSKGISLKPYLHELRDISFEELKDNFSETFKTQDLKTYILAEFRLPEDERHNWANWWGIVQLTDVHRNIYPEEVRFNSGGAYPGEIQECLKNLRNQQALYLYGHSLDLSKTMTAQVKKFYTRLIQTKDYQIKLLEKKINGMGKIDPSPSDWMDYLMMVNEIIEDSDPIKKSHEIKQEEFEIILDEAEKTIVKLQEGRTLLKRLRGELNALVDRINNFGARKINVQINELQKIINSSRFTSKSEFQPKIIYIDDKANEGWAEIFQILIYGIIRQDLFRSFVPVSSKSIEEIFTEVNSIIREHDPDIILLDLRLKNEAGTQLKVEDLSGFKVLQSIRAEFLGTPVVITTASNKAWNFEGLINIGADAFWVKEGIDTSASLSQFQRDNFSANNYEFLIRTIATLCNKKYQFLKRFGNHVKAICKNRNERPWWWKNHTSNLVTNWNTSEYFRRSNNLDNIFDILEDAVATYRRFLYKHEVTQIDFPKRVVQYNLEQGQIIGKLSGIIEAIHFGDQSFFDTRIVGRENLLDASYGRHDWVAWFLFQYRNNASHFSSSRYSNTKRLHSFIAGLISWLDGEFLEVIADNKLPGGEFFTLRGSPWWYKKISYGQYTDIVDHFERMLSSTCYESTYQKLMN